MQKGFEPARGEPRSCLGHVPASTETFTQYTPQTVRDPQVVQGLIYTHESVPVPVSVSVPVCPVVPVGTPAVSVVLPPPLSAAIPVPLPIPVILRPPARDRTLTQSLVSKTAYFL